jgi:hypothetical protein
MEHDISVFKFYVSHFDAIETLTSDRAKGVLYSAVFNYVFNGFQPDFKRFSKETRLAWGVIFPHLKRQRDGILTGQKGAEFGKLSQENQQITEIDPLPVPPTRTPYGVEADAPPTRTGYPNVKENVNVNDNDNAREKESLIPKKEPNKFGSQKKGLGKERLTEDQKKIKSLCNSLINTLRQLGDDAAALVFADDARVTAGEVLNLAEHVKNLWIFKGKPVKDINTNSFVAAIRQQRLSYTEIPQ